MRFTECRPAWLLLADGTLLQGRSFGAQGSAIGEVVFSTGMTGYEETLTDPSYYGQIVTQTFPLVGDYGVNDEDVESDSSVVRGYVVRQYCQTPSNFRSQGDIDGFLKKHYIIGLWDVDTRALTRKLREVGVMNGLITTEPVGEDREALLQQLREFSIRGAVAGVSCKEPKTYPAQGEERYRVALLDYGHKFSIRRCLTERGCTVTVLPHTTTAEQIRALAPDGILLSNGPGDPHDNPEAIENLKGILRLGIPTFGICLGHQLAALANGAVSHKLKYGHRGANQPVKDLDADRVFVTSQNHGYALVSESLPATAGRVTHVNVNDGTCEGIRYHNAPVFTVQFHPEACAGPQDTAYLFDEFIAMMEKGRNDACR